MSGKEFNCAREKYIPTKFLSDSIYDKRGGLLHKTFSGFVLFLPQSSAGLPKKSRPSQSIELLLGKCGPLKDAF